MIQETQESEWTRDREGNWVHCDAVAEVRENDGPEGRVLPRTVRCSVCRKWFDTGKE